MRSELENLETALGHHFQHRDLLIRALTHSSRVNERPPGADDAHSADNEQMEFLGDAVLGFLVSEALVASFPGYPEGRLSKLKAHLVSAAHLYAMAQRLDLGKYLLLGRGEEMSGGRAKRTLLVDGLEALIAAVYLDSGIDAVRRLVNRCVIGDGDDMLVGEIPDNPIVDFKSALQELAQARKLPPPRYVMVREHGPEHAKTFTIEARVGHDWVGQADGGSKKSAAQSAARDVLTRLAKSPSP